MDKEYRIAGTYHALNREDTQSSSVGSVFLVNPQAYTYYFKTLHSDITPVALEKITEICRRYVPRHCLLTFVIRVIPNSPSWECSTLADSIPVVGDSQYPPVDIKYLFRNLHGCDKSAKRSGHPKINGATPRVIALLFGKIYLIIYLSVFVIIYPLVRLVLISITQKSNLQSIYSWSWGVLLFFTMALLIFLVTAYKIYKVMHLNPASVLKKE